jgi:acyl-CoA thioesterase-1
MNSRDLRAPARRALLGAAIALPFSTAFLPASSSGASKPALLVLGDSLSAEYGLARGTGWVPLLGERLREQHYDYEIVNASISGETTSGGVSRIDELLKRVQPAIVVVELGGNDALRGLPLEQTSKNLATIVARSKAARASVLIIGMQIPPNYGKAYADRFAGIFTSTAKEYGTALTPFFFAGFADRDDLFQADRIHPTAAAQSRLLENAWPALQPLLKKR